MKNHVFISYSNKDRKIADKICVSLEKNNIDCWYAPRNIIAGENWAGSIIKAISSAKAMVLVFSSNSNISIQVQREVERAVNKKVIIIPFRIENIELSEEMEYYISKYQWLDATTDSLEHHIDSLFQSIRKIVPSSITYSVGTNHFWWKVIDSGDRGEDVVVECTSCTANQKFDPIFGEKPTENCPVCGFDGVKKPSRNWYIIQSAGFGDRDITCRKCKNCILVSHYESDFKIPEKCPKCGFL